jgi:hypothetical protein
MSQGSPLGQLPIDPVNQSSTRNYDTYTTNGSQYELTTALESSKYKLGGSNDSIGNDGGTLAGTYERGTKLGLEPLDYGDSSLVGYWTFDEGTGSTTYDYSGGNNTTTFACGGTGCSDPSWAAGRVGNNSLYFNPASSQMSYVQGSCVNNPSVSGSVVSISLWINPNASQSNAVVFMRNGYSSSANYYLMLGGPSSGYYSVALGGYSSGSGYVSSGPTGYIVPANAWSYLTVIFTQGQNARVYLNGAFQGTISFSYVTVLCTNHLSIGSDGSAVQTFNGYLYGVRVYSRALSAAEIAALYNGNK